MSCVAILGAGGMGTALAMLFGKAGTDVRLWSRDCDYAERFARSRINERHLPGIEVARSVRITAEIDEAVDGSDLIVAAVPTSYLRTALARLAPSLPGGVPVLSVVKGIEYGTFARPSQIVLELLGQRSIAVLSGPSHAEELARGLPASVVVAGNDDGLNGWIRDELSREMFRVYTSRDALGVELAGALKNILGIAAGICDGLGSGDNAKAALLTRGLVEVARLGVDLGARQETFYGLAGLGDVITTCYSPYGRNVPWASGLARVRRSRTCSARWSMWPKAYRRHAAFMISRSSAGLRCRSHPSSTRSCSRERRLAPRWPN
jgi:glycerol-3-phosphate dehydrogenase (NAD(P)+)